MSRALAKIILPYINILPATITGVNTAGIRLFGSGILQYQQGVVFTAQPLQWIRGGPIGVFPETGFGQYWARFDLISGILFGNTTGVWLNMASYASTLTWGVNGSPGSGSGTLHIRKNTGPTLASARINFVVP
jgi:hypothetical protein